MRREGPRFGKLEELFVVNRDGDLRSGSLRPLQSSVRVAVQQWKRYRRRLRRSAPSSEPSRRPWQNSRNGGRQSRSFPNCVRGSTRLARKVSKVADTTTEKVGFGTSNSKPCKSAHGRLRCFASVSLSQGRASGLGQQAAIRKRKARSTSDCGRTRPLLDSGHIPASPTHFANAA